MPILVEEKTTTCKEKVALRTTFPEKGRGRQRGGAPSSPHSRPQSTQCTTEVAPAKMATEESFNTQLLGLPMPLERGKTRLCPPGPRMRQWPMMGGQSSGRQPPGPLSDSALTPPKAEHFLKVQARLAGRSRALSSSPPWFRPGPSKLV